MRIGVVLVGDELLTGQTRDANAFFVTAAVTSRGHRVRRVLIVPDEVQAIQSAVDDALTFADVIIVSGGLGPTHDDRTTEALAERFHRRLVVDEASWERLVARYAGRDISENARQASRKMVTVPEGAEVRDNPVGAAPAYILRRGDQVIAVLPGVPSEFAAIFEAFADEFLPRRDGGHLIELDVALAEAAFAQALADVADRFADVEIGSYPKSDELRVTLRFRGRAGRPQEALDAFLDAYPRARDRILPPRE